MHKAAMAHYAHLSMDEKQKVLRSFEEKDANGDRQVTLGEYRTFYSSCEDFGRISVALTDLFKHLDKNKDGTLDFEEFIACYYVLFNSKYRFCDACGSIVWGVYFVCVECYNVDKENSYDLCCSCYHKKNFSHVHSYFLDTNALLCKIQCEDIKGKMEEMREVAMAYYAKLPNDQKQLVWSFFKTLDGNGDGKVSIQEYSDFVKETGRSKFLTPNLFKLLDKNHDGTLDFEECVTIFYMIKSHRLVFCDGCGSYMLGIHFICVECYNVGKGTYDLCCSCYRNNNFNHVHSFFLDNYALLRAKPWEDNTQAVVKSRSKSKEWEEGIRELETVVSFTQTVHDVATNCATM